jgi:transposase
MKQTQPQLISPSALAPDNVTATAPFAQQTVVLTKQAYIELKWEANYWRAQQARLVEREAALKREVETLQATIRDLNQRLYGTKSEKSSGTDGTPSPKADRPKNRGQQPGSKGHGRRDRFALPVVAEVHDLSEEAKRCPICGAAFVPFPGTEASDIIEVEVQAHIRRLQRQRYRKGCTCPQVAGIITAPPAPRLIPKSPFGVSVWTQVLLDKYLYGRPTHRLCEALNQHGLPLAQGTLTDGLHKMAALFEPLMPLLRERQMGEKLFYGDETRWQVFEAVEGKTGYRWYLWVMHSVSVVFYRMAPGRGAEVPQSHFDTLHRDLVEVVLVCDRYSAYKSFAKSVDELILAYCWAHVRRDFLRAARSWPELEDWMWSWVHDIGTLYQLNSARLMAWDDALPLAQQPLAFVECHDKLKSHLGQMQGRCEAYLQEPDLPGAKRKVLSSLQNHWEGLTVFVERPEVAMDNNTAERALRNPVVGRKNYYGSGRVWSAHLAAMLFSVRQTILLWGLNPHHWLRAFLQACADHGGKSPEDLNAFLPWQMTPERRAELTRPVPPTLTPRGDPAAPDTS